MSGGEHHLSSFLEMLSSERGATQNTLDAYTRDLNDFMSFLASRDRTLESADAKIIQAYLHKISEDGQIGRAHV